MVNTLTQQMTSEIEAKDWTPPMPPTDLIVDRKRDRLGWVVREEEGRYPDTITER
ncbi:MAG: hypothetical protein ACKO7R_14945 [Pseudanabaena sp.]